MKLAAMDHNVNVDRKQATTKPKEGRPKPKFKIAYHRYSKRFVAKKIKVDKSYRFLRDIAVECYFRAVDGDREKKENRLERKRLFVTPSERPSREEIIENSTKYSRIK